MISDSGKYCEQRYWILSVYCHHYCNSPVVSTIVTLALLRLPLITLMLLGSEFCIMVISKFSFPSAMSSLAIGMFAITIVV